MQNYWVDDPRNQAGHSPKDRTSDSLLKTIESDILELASDLARYGESCRHLTIYGSRNAIWESKLRDRCVDIATSAMLIWDNTGLE